jgi:hypothetical protein
VAITRFLYPIVDSGYFFDSELLDVIKEDSRESFSLKLKYRLTNNYPIRLQIPIKISQFAYLNCTAENDFASDESSEICSDCVMDLQNNHEMYGYGDDHYVIFEPSEKKEFLVLFQASEQDFQTFDTEFFMKPDDDEYGLYRLRYDFSRGQIIKRYCLRKYTVNMKPFPN